MKSGEFVKFMCRMFVVLNPRNLNDLLDDFVLISKGKNELHEKYENCVHDSGNGVAWFFENEFSYQKTVAPYYDSYQNLPIKNLNSLNPSIVIVHARKGLNTSIENCHPFAYYNHLEHWLFCHNGTIFDDIKFSEKFKVKGTTDSEKLFYAILSQQVNAENIKKLTLELKNYSGANFILANKDKIFVNCQFNSSHYYYTMKLYQNDDEIIVSSEVLRSKKDKWLIIPNGSLLEISVKEAVIRYV